MTTPEKSTLSAGKYQIEFAKGSTQIFVVDEFGNKAWVCSTTDPNKAMEIVEGLVLVETKRFYHPESQPKVASTDEKIVPPFLRKNNAAG